MPALSFLSKMSYLFRKRIRSTFASRTFEQISFQSVHESSCMCVSARLGASKNDTDKTIHAAVLGEILIKARDRSEEYNRVH